MIVYILGGIVGSLIRDYPLTRVVRYFLKKTNASNKQISILTYVISFLIVTLLLVAIGSDIVGLGIISSVISLAVLLFIDLQRSKESSKVLNFLNHIATRIVLGVITFLLLLALSINLLPLITGNNESSYIIEILIASIYVYLSFRKWK